MGVSIDLTGSGTIGDISSGWTVQEDATPVAPSDSSGSVGQISFTAAQGQDSEFVLDNLSTFTHDTLGSLSGKIDTLDSNGADEDTDTDLNLTATTPLGQLSVQRTAQPTFIGSQTGYLFPLTFARTRNSIHPITGDLVLSDGTIRGFDSTTGVLKYQYNPPSGKSINGVAIDSSGNFYAIDGNTNLIDKYGPTGTYLSTIGASGSGAGQLNLIIDIAVDAASVYVLQNQGADRRVVKFSQAGVYQTQWGSSGIGNGQFSMPSSVAVDPAGNVYVNDMYTTVLDTQLTPYQRVQVFSNTGTFIRSWITTVPNANLAPPWPSSMSIDSGGTVWIGSYYDGSASYPGNIGVQAYTSTGSLAANLGNINQPSSSTPGFWFGAITDYRQSAVYLIQTASDRNNITTVFIYSTFGSVVRLSDVFNYYIRTLVGSFTGISYMATANPNVVFQAWSADVWTQLKQLCTAYNVEISVVNNIITIRDVGTRTLVLDNVIGGSAKLSINSQSSAQVQNVKWYATSSGANVVFYDASTATDANVISIDAGQTSVTNLSTTNTPIILNNPVVSDTTGTPGTYRVMDSSNPPLNVPASLWTAAGGLVSAAIDPTTLGQINVTVTAPVAITGYIGPFLLQSYPGVPDLSITGSGVISIANTLTLQTGADATKSETVNAPDVDNIFLNTLTQAYDRGIWASALAAGPTITLSINIPTNLISSFGLTNGSLVSFKESIYRITSAQVGNASISVTAIRHVRVSDIDTLYSGKTVGQVDTFWSANVVEDTTIKPLRAIV